MKRLVAQRREAPTSWPAVPDVFQVNFLPRVAFLKCIWWVWCVWSLMREKSSSSLNSGPVLRAIPHALPKGLLRGISPPAQQAPNLSRRDRGRLPGRHDGRGGAGLSAGGQAGEDCQDLPCEQSGRAAGAVGRQKRRPPVPQWNPHGIGLVHLF